jgi:hypothetical protein
VQSIYNSIINVIGIFYQTKVLWVILFIKFTDSISVTKVIRVKEQTFKELIERGKWSDTMDMIISRLLRDEASKSEVAK